MATAEVILGRREFANEPLTDFSKPENRSAMEAALKKVAGELGREYALLIGGEKVTTEDKLRSINPSRPEQAVGIFSKASAELAKRAVEEADRAFASWKKVPVDERAAILFRTADLIRKRKFEMSSWLCYETGKTWPEADADIAELIDFCEFYGREALRYFGPQPVTPIKGEKNQLVYIPLGVGAVIPPWNFAAAIMGGMTSAALVTGNTVVLKPSSDSPTIAWKFVELLHEAGLPVSALQFCPARAGRWATRLPCIQKRASSPSPDRKRSVCASVSWPRSRSLARSGSSGRFSRWAARTPSSWTKRPMWTRRSKVWRFPHSATRGRSAPRARARLSRKKSTTSSSRN